MPPWRRAWTVGARSLRWRARSMEGLRLAPWPYMASNLGSYQGMINSPSALGSRSARAPGVPGSVASRSTRETPTPSAFIRASSSHRSFPFGPNTSASLRIVGVAVGGDWSAPE